MPTHAPIIRIPLSVVALALVMTAAPFAAGCDASFADQVKLVSLAINPAVEALPISEGRQAAIDDGAQIAALTATFATNLKRAIGDAAKLAVVDAYDVALEPLLMRPELHTPNLDKIFGLVRGVIASARIYYGDTPPAAARATAARVITRKQARADMDAKMTELKAILEIH